MSSITTSAATLLNLADMNARRAHNVMTLAHPMPLISRALCYTISQQLTEFRAAADLGDVCASYVDDSIAMLDNIEDRPMRSDDVAMLNELVGSLATVTRLCAGDEGMHGGML